MPQSFAHPVYVDSSPKAFQSVPSSPTEVNVFFSEPIELGYSTIRVLGPDGSTVDMNDPHNVEGDTASMGVTLQPNLPEGQYTVTTKVLSAVDGHVVEETFVFGVGAAVQQLSAGDQRQKDILSPEESASRFPGMVGQVIVVGAAFATLWLWKPLARVPWLSNAISKTRVSIDRNMMRLIIIGTGFVLASGVAMIVVQAISINAGIPEAIATKFGNVWLTRMLQSSILMGIAVAVYRKAAKNNATASKAEIYAILILGLAVLVTSSLIAHAAATSQIGPMLLDFFHNAAASIWIGGLILLGFVAVPKILSIGDERIKSAALSILIPRFSTVVVTLLGISVITGPVLLFALESNLSLTLASVYGQILLIKLGLAGVMVAMGAYSQFVVQKKAVSVMVGAGGDSRGGGATGVHIQSLRNYDKLLKAEASVGIALLLMVSLMANGALPSGQFPVYEREQLDGQAAFAEAAAPTTDFMRTLYTGEGTIKLTISPFVVGQNTFKLSFFKQDGSNATGIESATIKLTQIERGIGPITVETKEQSDNVFSADAAFSLPSVWHIEIEGVNTQGSNMLAVLDTNVKPMVSDLQFDTKLYNTSVNSLPLFPVFDAARQSIWVGDSLPGSGKIWQLNIDTGAYTMHKINATLVTQSVLASDGSIWYIDPLGTENNGVVGFYNPSDNSSRRFVIPQEGIPSGIAIDGNGSIWMPIVAANGADKVIKFDPTTEKFSSYDIPTPDARPAGIASDRIGNIWLAEAGADSIAKIDPATGNITEYKPKSLLQTLDEPTAVFPDPDSFNIYISEHSGHTITVFNSLLGTFRGYPSVDEAGLPFGMAMDSYGNLWFAQHEIDKIGAIDPRTGEGTEAKIPIAGSFVQWITSDDEGRIWFAAQRGSALGSITIMATPASTRTIAEEGQQQNGTSGPTTPIQQIGFSFADIAGPGIAAGIVISALAYAKSATDLKRNIRGALRINR
jgi:copper transport protein